jgi:hypothetical protein
VHERPAPMIPASPRFTLRGCFLAGKPADSTEAMVRPRSSRPHRCRSEPGIRATQPTRRPGDRRRSVGLGTKESVARRLVDARACS